MEMPGQVARRPRGLLAAPSGPVEGRTPGRVIVPGEQRLLGAGNYADRVIANAPQGGPQRGVRTVGGLRLDADGKIIGSIPSTEAVGEITRPQLALGGQQAIPGEAPGAQAPARTAAPPVNQAAPVSSAEAALQAKLAKISDDLATTSSRTQIRKLIEQRKEVMRRIETVRKTAPKIEANESSVYRKYSPEVLGAARREMENAVRLWDELPPPARNFDEGTFDSPTLGRRAKDAWTATSSPRPMVEDMFEWVKDNPDGLSDLKKALERGTGASYERWLDAAAGFVKKHPELIEPQQ